MPYNRVACDDGYEEKPGVLVAAHEYLQDQQELSSEIKSYKLEANEMPGLSDAKVAAVIRAYKDSHSILETHKATGVSRAAIRRTLRKAGIATPRDADFAPQTSTAKATSVSSVQQHESGCVCVEGEDVQVQQSISDSKEPEELIGTPEQEIGIMVGSMEQAIAETAQADQAIPHTLEQLRMHLQHQVKTHLREMEEAQRALAALNQLQDVYGGELAPPLLEGLRWQYESRRISAA